MERRLPEQQNIPHGISRREFIKGAIVSAAIILGTYAAAEGIFGVIRTTREWFSQRDAWKRTGDVNKYFAENEERLSQATLGCSFAPERFEGLNLSRKNQNPQGIAIAKEGLAYLIDELGMKEIRLNIRWNNVVYKDEQGREQVDLSFYEPFIQECLDRNANICLNLGPIKSFGWPEEHLPRGLTIPPDSAEIKSSDPLAQKSLNYLDTLLAHLKQKYAGQENRFTQIQPENEAFNRFGEHPWKIGNEYLLQVIDKIHAAFPSAGVLLNAPGTTTNGNPLYPGVAEMADFIKQHNDRYGGSLQLGYNYYHYVPGYPELFGQMYDSNAFVDVPSGFDTFKKIRASEVTEMQAEPWNNFTAPGNDSHEFLFALDRSLSTLPVGRQAAIRVWGVERLLQLRAQKQLTKEHEKILQVIQRVNKKVA